MGRGLELRLWRPSRWGCRLEVGVWRLPPGVVAVDGRRRLCRRGLRGGVRCWGSSAWAGRSAAAASRAPPRLPSRLRRGRATGLQPWWSPAAAVGGLAGRRRGGRGGSLVAAASAGRDRLRHRGPATACRRLVEPGVPGRIVAGGPERLARRRCRSGRRRVPATAAVALATVIVRTACGSGRSVRRSSGALVLAFRNGGPGHMVIEDAGEAGRSGTRSPAARRSRRSGRARWRRAPRALAGGSARRGGRR